MIRSIIHFLMGLCGLPIVFYISIAIGLVVGFVFFLAGTPSVRRFFISLLVGWLVHLGIVVGIYVFFVILGTIIKLVLKFIQLTFPIILIIILILLFI